MIDTFVNNMTSGRGYIALAVVIFAGWRPLGAAAACLLIGLADAGQVWATVLGVDVPHQFLAMLPYVVTLVALAMLRRYAAMPRALGEPYVPEQR
jgi:simple sugar transport system permease protein